MLCPQMSSIDNNNKKKKKRNNNSYICCINNTNPSIVIFISRFALRERHKLDCKYQLRSHILSGSLSTDGLSWITYHHNHMTESCDWSVLFHGSSESCSKALKCNCFHISLSESELYLKLMSQTLAITHQVVNSSSTGFMDHSIWVAALDIDPCCHSHLWFGPGDHLLACCPRRHHGVGRGYSCDHSGFAHIAGDCLQG